MHKCAKCDTVLPAENPKRCSACREACYCSQKCQQEHWPLHIFDCKPGQPISTVYYLARAIHNNIVPSDPQTRIDYGFEKIAEHDGRSSEDYLLIVYAIVLKSVSPQNLRRWQRNGRLAPEIKALFEAMPPETRGGGYKLFLKYERIFDRPDDVEKGVAHPPADTHMNKLYRDGWIHMGGDPKAPQAEIDASIRALSPRARFVHYAYIILFASELPAPQMPAWLAFGFVTTSSEREVSELGMAYIELVHYCTFDEFLEAYNEGRMPGLFRQYRVALPKPRVFEAMMGDKPDMFDSVWYLKAHVDILQVSKEDNAERFYDPKPATRCGDYGYDNVRDKAESKLLDELYLELFGKVQKGMDPLELHQACMDGKLVEYVSRFVKLGTHAALYKRLLNKRTSLGRRGELSLRSLHVVAHDVFRTG
ncbi:uncharacterized protein BXZ73DRAFT_43872 [Epithele typhae]|uniref:uncharacterized protein n=1 Tax=Epithele typhae TaxID=378194 RepID=UPI00200751B0|nr:uncharacterized protein BXZ73DRAFT_43872 [Epithele typhae]KAH9939371.1 hypothetical protein BXZ73DRAFT_43872 [Epithele typhae]